jgi:methionyl-tRNA synthetase
MLKALELPLPTTLLAHGWWSINGAKMSKSTGNFVEPAEYADKYGVDALRYFLIREMSVGQDSDFSQTQFLARYNGELANNLGNLVNRVLNMTNRFAGGVVPSADAADDEPESVLKLHWEMNRVGIIEQFEKFQFHIGLGSAFDFITATNAYIEKRAPWKLGKSAEPADQALLRTVIATMAEALRLAATLLPAVMPGTTEKIHGVLGHQSGPVWREELVWGARLTGNKVAEAAILFPKPEGKPKGA